MDKDLIAVRWATFFGLITVAALFVFPRLATNPSDWIGGALLILVAAALLTIAVESSLHYLIRRLTPPATPTSDNGAWLVRYNEELFAAQDSAEVVLAAMRAGRGRLGAAGVSFIPFDGWGMSFPPLTEGRLPQDVLPLFPPATILRQTCRRCGTRHPQSDCPLLLESASAAEMVLCLPLRENGREIGVLNFFGSQLASSPALDYIASCAESALASMRRRDREIAALRHLQSSSTQREFPAMLADLCQTLAPVLGADSACFWLPDGVPGELPTPALITEADAAGQQRARALTPAFLDGIWQTLRSSRDPLAIENVTFEDGEARFALRAIPLVWRDESPVGLLLLISPQPLDLTDHQRLILHAVAGEAALIVQNSWLIVRVQYQAVLDERTRLAREIHDGMAQTLAFLKIQAAQMHYYLEQGKMERLEQALAANHQTLAEAYQDARLAIDNLRNLPETSTPDWLERVARDLQESSGLPVTINRLEIAHELPPTAQVQLIRIVQEAFNNIRKHSHARAVNLEVWEEAADLILEIRDDGIGFDPSRMELESHYGILGMQERAELLGAKLELESQPDHGTLVRLEVPNGARG